MRAFRVNEGEGESVTKRVYVAGPMTGIKDFNYPAFHAAAAKWKKAGWRVINPADDPDTTKPRPFYMRRDILNLCACQAIAFLPGWKNSRGALMEYIVGFEMGLDLYAADTMEPLPDVSVSFGALARSPQEAEPQRGTETVLQEAQRIVFGPRQETYGHPRDDYTQQAALWSALWMHKLKEPLTAHEAALGMVTLKARRALTSPQHRDNYTDMAGYAEVGARIAGIDP